MLKNKLIIMPIDGSWEHSADFFRQTALTLSGQNQVIIYDQNNAHFFLKKPTTTRHYTYKNINFHQVKYFLPLRRFTWIEKINHLLSFWLFLQKYKKIDKLLWIFYPNYFDLAKIKNKNMLSLYDCVDYNDDKKKENKLIQNVDYFFVNSLTLKNLHSNQIKKPIYINAQGFFLPNEKLIPKVQLKKTKPIIGLVGGINYRLDFSLLNKLIKDNPKWQFVFYGPKQINLKKDSIYKTNDWLKKIKKYQNVVFGQSKNRYEVYGLIKNFDIAIIPYDSTILFNKYCYPMKIFEYLYFEKKIISSDIDELKTKKFKNMVTIAKKNNDWQKKIEYLLKIKSSKISNKQKKKLAINNSWNNKIEKISKIIINNQFKDTFSRLQNT